jgi:hypothetical protein
MTGHPACVSGTRPSRIRRPVPTKPPSRGDIYRSQGADLRRMAAAATNEATKAEYLRLAVEYEKLAQEVDAYER